MLKVGVLGAGHLGKIHLRLLKESEHYQLVGFYDPDTDNAQKLSQDAGYHLFYNLDELINHVDVVILSHRQWHISKQQKNVLRLVSIYL